MLRNTCNSVSDKMGHKNIKYCYAFQSQSMDELASFLTPSSRLDVKLLALQQVAIFTYFRRKLKHFTTDISDFTHINVQILAVGTSEWEIFCSVIFGFLSSVSTNIPRCWVCPHPLKVLLPYPVPKSSPPLPLFSQVSF